MNRFARRVSKVAGTLALLALPLAARDVRAAATAARGSVAASAATLSRGPAAAPVLPWIADDYAGAVARAKARRLPIFVESWAPW